jgi:hypothetical protein
MAEFIDITSAAMDPSWISYERGTLGTLAHRLGGCWWCRRCFATSVDRDHVCSDIVSGGRRWVRANLLAELTGEATSKGSINPTATDVLDKIDTVLEDFVSWHGSEDAADSEADDLDLPCGVCGWEPDEGSHDDDDHEFEPGPRWSPTGEFGIYGEGVDGYRVYPDDALEDADEPVWCLGAVETDGTPEWRYNDLVSDVTLADAVKAARERDVSLGAMLGAGDWIDAFETGS